MTDDWLNIDLSLIDTPALIIDQSKVIYNISKAIDIVGSVDRLRPHVKTHKMLEVTRLQIKAGISKFKCATISEAEMLGRAGAEDVLIAYPVQGPKIFRVLQLIESFPDTRCSVLVDNPLTALEINQIFSAEGKVIDVFIDMNVGQDRTGVKVDEAKDITLFVLSLDNVNLRGLHCYDGHIHMPSYVERGKTCKEAFERVFDLKDELQSECNCQLTVIAGGSPTFPVHAKLHDVECSPGTFVFWDEGYGSKYQEQEFKKAAILVTRVISKIDDQTYCLDLGYKSVASESPLPRVKFISSEDIEQIGHSEEHMVIKTQGDNSLKVGQVMLAYPFHICPTVALYDQVLVASFGRIIGQWHVTARKRKITI